MAIPDADVVLAALRLARPAETVSEKALRAAIQHARSLSLWPIDEPGALFYAFGCRPRIAPSLGVKLAIFMARQQLAELGLELAASDADLRELRMQILTRAVDEADVLAWFAERIPAH